MIENSTERIPDKDKAIVCACGSVSFALRGDGFCECHKCGKDGFYQWVVFEPLSKEFFDGSKN